jgi:hypothetical protein
MGLTKVASNEGFETDVTSSVAFQPVPVGF